MSSRSCHPQMVRAVGNAGPEKPVVAKNCANCCMHETDFETESLSIAGPEECGARGANPRAGAVLHTAAPRAGRAGGNGGRHAAALQPGRRQQRQGQGPSGARGALRC